MITRRSTVFGTALLGSFAASGIRLSASAADLLPEDAGKQLELFLKLKADSGGALAPVWYKAELFWQKDNDLLQLLAACEGFSWNRITPQGVGSFKVALTEAGYYVDPKSGERLMSMPHLETGEALPVKHFQASSEYMVDADEITVPQMADRRDLVVDLDRSPLIPMDDMVVAHEDLQSKFKPDSDGYLNEAPIENTGPASGADNFRRVSQMTSYFAPLSKVLDPETTSVAATSFSIMISDTKPWLPTLSLPLPIIWRLYGRKVSSVEAVSPKFRQWVEEDYPGFWSNPGI